MIEFYDPDSKYRNDPSYPNFNDPDVQKAARVLLESAFSIEMNMDDTFGFACTESEIFDCDDFDLMIPVLAKYGHHALTAYAAIMRDEEPITCKCCHGVEYKQAKDEILDIISKLPEDQKDWYFTKNR